MAAFIHEFTLFIKKIRKGPADQIYWRPTNKGNFDVKLFYKVLCGIFITYQKKKKNKVLCGSCHLLFPLEEYLDGACPN